MSLDSGPYNTEYSRTYEMRSFDNEPNALKRWFDNWKVERYAYFAADTEWLTIEPVKFTAASGKARQRYIGVIGADHHTKTRQVRFEDAAPEPPSFRLAARKKYVPPPPEPPFESIFDKRAAMTSETAHYIMEMQRRVEGIFRMPAQYLEQAATWWRPFPLPRDRRDLEIIERLLHQAGRRLTEMQRRVEMTAPPPPRWRTN